MKTAGIEADFPNRGVPMFIFITLQYVDLYDKRSTAPARAHENLIMETQKVVTFRDLLLFNASIPSPNATLLLQSWFRMQYFQEPPS
jgi:hypothetical protein